MAKKCEIFFLRVKVCQKRKKKLQFGRARIFASRTENPTGLKWRIIFFSEITFIYRRLSDLLCVVNRCSNDVTVKRGSFWHKNEEKAKTTTKNISTESNPTKLARSPLFLSSAINAWQTKRSRLLRTNIFCVTNILTLSHSLCCVVYSLHT